MANEPPDAFNAADPSASRRSKAAPASEILHNIPAETPNYDRPATSALGAANGPAASAQDEKAIADRQLGLQLARALSSEGYHPVILFGTTNSGKTSLLLSLFSALKCDPRLSTGIKLCDPVLNSKDLIGRKLHEYALKLFDIGTMAFRTGQAPPATTEDMPFFVPVLVNPTDKPAQRFAFLESRGEWYRQKKSLDEPSYYQLEGSSNAPEPQDTIEAFINAFQGGITFLYVAPYTQKKVYNVREIKETKSSDRDALHDACASIEYMAAAYDRARASYRADDRHLMLVTKWDARAAHQNDQAEAAKEDRHALVNFCAKHYGPAQTAFSALHLEPGQFNVNAYVSGKITAEGRVQQSADEDFRDVVNSYPPRLWNYLYRNALVASGQAPQSMFPEPKRQPGIIRAWHKLLDTVSGR